jgi:hypothetical protein
MTQWVIPYEFDDLDHASSRFPEARAAHAYDLDDHAVAHAIVGPYKVKPDEAWSGLAGTTRCRECASLVPRRPQPPE